MTAAELWEIAVKASNGLSDALQAGNCEGVTREYLDAVAKAQELLTVELNRLKKLLPAAHPQSWK